VVFNVDRHTVAKFVKEWTLYRDYQGEAPKTRLPRKMQITTDDVILPNEERAVAKMLVRGYIRRAKVSIYLMIYIFHLKSLAKELKAAVQERNVEGWVYLDAAEARRWKASRDMIAFLMEAGVKVRVSKRCVVMHRKHGEYDCLDASFGVILVFSPLL
jgi:phosphatidylserine/phosphatidylglycerophosphate/cardiolipin synthase-like enzyme